MSELIIKDEEEKVIKEINRIQARPWITGPILGYTKAIKFAQELTQPVRDIPDLTATCHSLGFDAQTELDLFEWAYDRVEAKERRLLKKREHEFKNKTANRQEYKNSIVFICQEGPEGPRWRYEGDTTNYEVDPEANDIRPELRASGLMVSACEYLAHKRGEIINEPIVIGFVNDLPLDDYGKQIPVPKELWDRVHTAGIAVSGNRLGWRRSSNA